VSPRFVAPPSVLVVGFARTGRAVAARLRALGSEVVALDDRRVEGAAAIAAALGARLYEAIPDEQAAGLAQDAPLVVASPGVPPSHPAIRAARPGSLVSEIELAYRLTDVPIVAVTGTNGKTTVTSLVAEMLLASGIEAMAAGNIGIPLVEAVPGPGREPKPGEPVLALIVAEVSSFQLAFVSSFRPVVGTWLNLAEDHLDWHPTFADYAACKARIWANQGPTDVAVANAADSVVLDAARQTPGRLVTFGEGGDYREVEGRLEGPGHETIVEVGELRRGLPHDRSNVLAAAATAIAAGASVEGCGKAARDFEVGPHRVELVKVDERGVSWFDDSKATTPSSVCAALGGFAGVVLIAGGRNKGLDLATIRRYAETLPQLQLRGVVAIGEAAGDVVSAFAGFAPVHPSSSMESAVDTAAAIAQSGDSVLLSPGCASFDWYSSYAERGADFTRHVLERAAGSHHRAEADRS
jgi:UDP-N-acetylmuramoylalanine--D-glutamate ligase